MTRERCGFGRWAGRGRARGAGRAAFLIVALFAVCARGAEPVPVNVQTAPGRFEISAVNASAAHLLAAATDEAWRVLAVPLTLPDAFSSPVFVRIAAPNERGPLAPFSVTVEPGGVVSLQLRSVQSVDLLVRRAVVQALLMRLAVSRHGVSERLQAPLWLEHACVGWWLSRADGAQLDALKYESRYLSPPSLVALLGWQRGRAEPREFSLAAVWLVTFLQGETGRAREWPALLERLLGGSEPVAALSATFPGRFENDDERELWWATGFHQARRARNLPILESEESRAQLAALARFVFAADKEDADRVVPLREILAHGAEPTVAAELARRATEVDRLISALHPFYRNAGLALGEVLRSAPKVAARRAQLCAGFEAEWREAQLIAEASSAALNATEQRIRRP